MANPYDDPRYELARALRQQRTGGTARTYQPSGSVGSTGSVKLGRAASSAIAANPTLKDQINRIAAGKKQESGGLLGTVLNNPLAKVALAPLEVLAIPGRAVVSGIREFADIVDANPNTTASFGDFVSQTRDKTFGFGKAFNINTGNKWLDRAIGFVGDVALDPITYATFGAGKFAGYGGRLQLSKKVLKETGDGALAQRVANYGRSAIQSSELMDKVGANRYGVYFLGKRVKVGKLGQGLRLPGSGAIGEFGDATLARLRIAASNTKVGKVLTKMTTRADFLDARMALRSGKLSPDAAGTVISALTLEPTRRAASGVAMQAETVKLQRLLGTEETMGLSGYRNTVHELLENPTLPKDPQAERAAQVWTDFFDNYENEVGRQLNEIDPSVNFQGVKNYFPWIRTDEAYRYVASNQPFSENLTKIFQRDPFEQAGRFKTRGLKPGDEWFGYTLKAEDLNVKRLNQIARDYGKVDFDFFETDIVRVAEKYIQDYAKEVGVLAGHKHLVDGGFWKQQQDIMRDTEIVDDVAVAAAKDAVAAVDKDIQEALGEGLAALGEFRDALTGKTSVVANQLDELSAKTGELAQLENVAKAANDVSAVLDGGAIISADQLSSVARRIGDARKKIAEMFGTTIDKNGKLKPIPDVLGKMIDDGEDVPLIAEGITNYLGRLETRVDELAQRVQGEFFDAQDFLEPFGARYADEVANLQSLQKEFEEAQTRVRVALEFGNYIESSIERIAEGVNPNEAFDYVDSLLVSRFNADRAGDKLSKEALKELKAADDRVINELRREAARAMSIFGKDVTVPSQELDNIRKAMGTSGGFEKFISEYAKGTTWGTYNRMQPIPVNSVSRYDVKTFYDNMGKLQTSEMSLTDVRSMAMFALARDQHLFAGRMPRTAMGVREKLIEALQGADYADYLNTQQMKRLASKQGMSARDIFDSQWVPARMRADAAKADLDELDSFLTEFGERFAANADETITVEALIDNLGSRYPTIERVLSANDEYVVSKVDFYEELMGARGNATEIIDDNGRLGRAYTDNEAVGFGREEISLREFLEQIKSERMRLDSYINGEASEVIGKGTTARTLNGAQVIEESEKLAKKLEPTGKQVVSNLRGSKGVSDVRMPRRVAANVSISDARNKLNDALTDYMLVSEVNMRFEAVANILSGFDMIPTEAMFSKIVDSVSAKLLPQIDNKISTITESVSILREIDKEVANRLRASAGTGKSPGHVFREVMSEYMNSPKGEVLKDGVGSVVAWTDDPYELRRGWTSVKNGQMGKEARKSFLETRLKTWYKSAYPNEKWSIERAEQKLKLLVSSISKSARVSSISPFAESATESTIAIWFRQILGDSAVQYTGKSNKVVAYNELQKRVNELRRIRRTFTRLVRPDIEMSRFFANPLEQQYTPSWYGELLRVQADKLENAGGLITQQRARLAELEGNRLALLTEGEEAVSAARRMRAGRELAPNVKRGTDLAKARADIKKFESITTSVNYASALRKDKITTRLEQLSSLDLSAVTDGFITGYGKDGTPLYALMPDGSRITFSKTEWESLFTPAFSQSGMRQAQSSLARMNQSIGRQRQLVQRIQDEIEKATRQRRATRPLYKRLEDEKSKLDVIVSERNQMKFDIDVSNPATRQSAVDKFEVLAEGRRGQEPYLTDSRIKSFVDFDESLSELFPDTRRGVITDFTGEALPDNPASRTMYKNIKLGAARMREERVMFRTRLSGSYYEGTKITPEAAARRASFVRNQWDLSEEAQLLGEAEKLRKSVYVVAYNDLINKPEALGRKVDELTKTQQRVLAELGLTQEEIVEISTTARAKQAAGVREAERRVGGVVGESRVIGPRVAGQPGQSPIDPELLAASLRTEADALQQAAVPTGPIFERRVGPSVPTAATESDIAIAGRGLRETEFALRQAEGLVLPNVQQAQAALRNTMKSLDDARVVEKALRAAQDDIVDEMAAVAGNADVFWELLHYRRTGFDLLNKRYEEMKNFVDSIPNNASTKQIKSLYSKSGKVDDLKARQTLFIMRDWIENNRKTIASLAENPDDPVNKAFAAAGIADGKLIELEFRRQDALERLAIAEQPAFFRDVVKAYSDEWQKAAKKAGILKDQASLNEMGLPGLYGNEEAVKVLQNVARINRPGVAADLSRFMSGYTRFFKAYATLSPGFHVRNTTSNIFSIFSAGADIENMSEGFRLYRSFAEHARKGGDLESWLQTLPADKVDNARIGAEVMLGLGGGRTDEALSDFVKQGGVIRDNPLLRWSHRTGHGVEGSGRFMLAYDSAVKGMDMSTSFERTHRYMIDYFNRSMLDESMRDIVPFWMWMSRNLPLQLINRWANPKSYLVYEKFARNFGLSISPQEGIPSYMQEQGGIRIGEDSFLSPDLPFSRIDQQIQEIANPRRLLGYVNPGIRVPLEVLGGTKFSSGIPFNDKYQKLVGPFAAFKPVLEAMGQVEYNSKGEPVVTERAMYAILGMIPPIGTAERLFPSTEQYKEKNAQSLLSFAGVPIRTVDKEAKEKELMRRMYEIQRMTQRGERIEGAE